MAAGSRNLTHRHRHCDGGAKLRRDDEIRGSSLNCLEPAKTASTRNGTNRYRTANHPFHPLSARIGFRAERFVGTVLAARALAAAATALSRWAGRTSRSHRQWCRTGLPSSSNACIGGKKCVRENVADPATLKINRPMTAMCAETLALTECP